MKRFKYLLSAVFLLHFSCNNVANSNSMESSMESSITGRLGNYVSSSKMKNYDYETISEIIELLNHLESLDKKNQERI